MDSQTRETQKATQNKNENKTEKGKETETEKKSIVNRFEPGANCQVFNGSITGCVFAMPGANVTQQAVRRADEARRSDEEERLVQSEEWALATNSGLIGEDGQPTVSRPEAALMANMMAERLGIAHKWKVFERLWHRNNMRGDYNTALDQRKSLSFQEKLKSIFG